MLSFIGMLEKKSQRLDLAHSKQAALSLDQLPQLQPKCKPRSISGIFDDFHICGSKKKCADGCSPVSRMPKAHRPVTDLQSQRPPFRTRPLQDRSANWFYC
eukprot:TRINITY_DN5314_c0_g1_i4.p1 TRINITY_DN5314_c0_g1~~TRINITY_DN5314_c0_g1_i4.p1  ORF type:complete len:101 (+),score=4.68 TRINITY_DN5314_c0_g1_i4:52-354(+)